ncbi:TIGR02217 family protein [Roseovarius sp. SYSU LYC5161]|uniref:phage distal tail protein, Rcc01695 family n=1 Tax=Roseovarius halophilus (ex Wu et al. 2025) TaxID=3376060 RepID=UPI00399AF607
MDFHEVRFPASLSFGSVGGPERLTDVVTLSNGYEERNTPWAHSRRRYDAGVAMRSLDDIETLIAFFEARRGQLFGFRWKDWTDFKSGAARAEPSYRDQVIATGDDRTVSFQLVKNYRSGGQTYRRPIRKPVAGTVRLGLSNEEQKEGVHYEVDLGTGIVTFAHPPNTGVEITAGYEFDVPVRFDTDRIQTSLASFQAGDVPNVPVVEIRA